MTTPVVIAIDGPSGSGKSSTSRGVADALDLAYLDTGSMYRAMTWAMLQKGIDITDPAAVAHAAGSVTIIAGTHPIRPTIEVDGVDVAEPIRSAEVTAAVSQVSAVPEVRSILVEAQRAAIAHARTGIVVEGRDIATTVAPHADLKIFLQADPVARAERRAAEVGAADAEAMKVALVERDAIDSGRAVSPLAKADDAILVDSTHLTLAEVIDMIVAMVPARAE